MPTRNILICTTIVSLFFYASGYAAQQPRTDNVATSMRNALLSGDIKDALTFYEVQAQQAEENAATGVSSLRNWGAAINAYITAGEAALFSAQLQKAVTYGEKALDIASRTRAPTVGRTNSQALYDPPFGELGAVHLLIQAYKNVRDFEKARTLLDRGFSLLKELQQNPSFDQITRLSQEGLLFSALGDDFLRRGEHPKAIDALSRAVELRRANFAARSRQKIPAQTLENSETLLIAVLVELARAYKLSGRLNDAEEQYSETLKHLGAGGTRSIYRQEVYLGLGEVYRFQKKSSLAFENFEKALSLAETEHRPEVIRSASANIALLLIQEGKPSDAIPHFQNAIRQTESTRSMLQTEKYRQSFFEGGLSVYADLIVALLLVGQRDNAFNYSERARSRSFLDILGSKVQLARSSAVMEHERALQARISVLRAMMEADGTNSEQAPQLRKELDEALNDYNDYLAKLHKENKEQASLMNVEPLTIKQVQERLDPGVTMLEYFVSGNNVWLWVVEKDRVEFASTSIARKDLVTKVTELRDTIYQFGEKDRFNTLSQELYKLLIQPALPHIRGKELVIVPHDVLHYLPFQALLGSDNRYLIEKYPIYYLSSASLMQFTQEKRRAMGEKVLAFGNPDLDDPQMALMFAEIEAGEIKKLCPQSTVLLKKEATEEKAKSLSPQNDIIHFASHAELNEDDPLASAIRLAKSDKEDGRLEVREIFGMDLKASLVVLSACETGLGKLSSGDELVGLTRAFIYAGTPSVVASLWNVEDSSTAQLMASFYKNLKTMTKVEALRQAQLNLIRGKVNSDLLARRGIGGIGKLGEVPTAKPAADSISNSPLASVSTSHPFFWAPFILVGEGK